MTIFVDESIELWHSQTWSSSIRSTFDDVCYNQNNRLIVLDDIVQIDISHMSEWAITMSRIMFIDRNHRSKALTSEEIRVMIQSVVEWSHSVLKDIDNLSDSDRELVIEKVNHEISFIDILLHLNIYLDREYDDENDDTDDSISKDRYIRRVLNRKSFTIRSFCRLQFTRDELKISYFDREHVEEYFENSHTFLSYMLFIDDFEVHRNMYRALKIFYLISVNLSYDERRKLTNVFTLILRSHDVIIENVINTFAKSIRQLDRDISLIINEDEQEICAFSMSLLEDMSQQTVNEKFSHHSAQKECRSCFCSKKSRENLTFNTIQHERYHFETIKQRQHVNQLVEKDRKMFLRETDLRSKTSVIARLCSALNLIQTRTYDASHSEWRSLKRILHSFLITSMLSKKDNTQYLKIFQNFSYSLDWSRIQSFMFYIDSWSLSKADRISILLSLILRSHVTMRWFRLSYLQDVRRVLNVKTSSLRVIVKVFDVIVEFNTLVDSQRYIYFERLHDIIVKARQAYQDLIRCDMNSAQIFQLDSESVEKVFHNLDVETDSLNENNFMIEVLFVVAESVEFELEFSLLISRAQSAKRTKKKKRERKLKENKFDNLLRLLNVHADLHLVDNAREYVTIMNVNVLAEEMKHMFVCLFTLLQMLKWISESSRQWQTTSHSQISWNTCSSKTSWLNRWDLNWLKHEITSNSSWWRRWIMSIADAHHLFRAFCQYTNDHKRRTMRIELIMYVKIQHITMLNYSCLTLYWIDNYESNRRQI